MSRFTEFTGITLAPKKKNKWITTKDLYFEVGEKGSNEKIIVPKWFEFDGASIPRIFWSIYPPTEPSTILAVCIHDRLYHIKGRVLDYYMNNNIEFCTANNYTREEADSIMYQWLIAQWNSIIKAKAYLFWVHIGWWYRRNQPLTEDGKKYLNLISK